MRIIDIGQEGATEDFANRLAGMLESVGSEVQGQREVYAEYLSLCCMVYTRTNPMARLMHGTTADFAHTCMALGYYLAQKPHELEAQLMELRATYGTTEIDAEED